MIVRHAPGARRLTLGADKAYDTHAFVANLRELHVTPHVAQNDTNRRSAIDRRTTQHADYGQPADAKAHRGIVRLGQDDRGLARPMFRGVERLRFKFTLTMASYNLIRIPKLLAAAA